MLDLRAIDEEREERLRTRLNDGRDSIAIFEEIARVRCDPPSLLEVRRALTFASDVRYDHPGLSRGAYLAHSLRLAGWALQLDDPPDVYMSTIALLHNLYEVSGVQFADVVRRFNTGVAGAIALLTIDRSQRDHVAYRQRYYQDLQGSDRRVCVVKVLDKLDNLFLLCLNADDAVRMAYLQEVEDFVLPLAMEHLKGCVPYLQALVRQCRIDGHIPLDRFSMRSDTVTIGVSL